jgi:hypothetical protein
VRAAWHDRRAKDCPPYRHACICLFGDDGFLYVASRNSKEILRYRGIDGRPRDKPFIKELADNPEILMLVRH